MDDTAGTLMEVAKAAGQHQYMPTAGDAGAGATLQQTDLLNHASSSSSSSNGHSAAPLASGSSASQSTPKTNSRKRKAAKQASPDASQISNPQQQHLAPEQPHDASDSGAAAQAAAAAAAVAATAYLQRESDEQQQHVASQHNMYAPDHNTTIEEAYQGHSQPGPATHSPNGVAGPSQHNATVASPPAEGGESSPGQAGRTLSSTKRAAQNRAAQRAFRERRDRHVKDLEVRAAQYEALHAVFTNLQARYDEALGIIEQLTAENKALRDVHAQAGAGGVGESLPSAGYDGQVHVGAADRAAAFVANNRRSANEFSNSHVDAATAATADAHAAAAAAAATEAGIGLDAVASAAAGAARLQARNGEHPQEQGAVGGIDPAGASLASMETIGKLLPDCSFDAVRPSLRFDAEAGEALVPLFTRRCPWLPSPNVLHFVPLSLHGSVDHLRLFTEWQNSPRVEQGWKQAWPEEKQREYLENIQKKPDILGLVGYWSDSEDTLGEPWGYVETYWVKESNLTPFYDFAPQTLGFHALVGEERFRGPNRVRAWMPSVVYMLFSFDARCDLVVSEPDINNAKMVGYECECGGQMEKAVDLPHKQAAMIFFRKADFLGRTWPLGPRDEEQAA